MYTPCGTPLYMAPEVLNKRAYNYKADLYSIGLIGYFMLTRENAFSSQTLEDLKREQEKFTP